MLIGCQLVVSSGKRPLEEGQGTCPLVKNGAEADTRSIAVCHKLLIKVWHLQHWFWLIKEREHLSTAKDLAASGV
jgi:hypothetical protein